MKYMNSYSRPALPKAIVCLFVSLLVLWGHVHYSHAAELEVDINRGVIEPLPIAITSFYEGDVQQDNSFSKDIPAVVSNDLEGSGLFRSVSSKAFIQSLESLSKDGPNFGEWRATGAQALVTGNVVTTSDGRTRVEFYLWDVLSQQKLVGMAYTTTPNNWRRIAHIIADTIYTRLTGEDGYFDSRIVYVAESGPAQKRVKRLAIMDQDGANHKYLTDGESLVLTPRFSPTRQQITYMSYDRGKPTVYLYNLNNGDHRPLGSFPGMTFAPRFSPDGDSVIMSMARNGNTDIYEMGLKGRSPKRITTSSAIDTSPSFAPDGKKIVFESDRGGTQQLYTMDRDGDNVERITFGKGRYANPVWSPRGDLIAFTRMAQGNFYIGVIRPDGSGERLIATAHHVEGPTWSPNGRVLSYFKEKPVGPGGRNRQARIYTVDITGYNEQWLQTPVDGSDPAWSPRNEL